MEDQLDRIANQLNSLSEALSIRTTITIAVKRGELLIRAKAIVRNEGLSWLDWLRANRIRERTARLHMEIARAAKTKPALLARCSDISDFLALKNLGHDLAVQSRYQEFEQLGASVPSHQDFQLLHTDFRQLQTDRPVSCVVIDPPWDKASMHLYGEAAKKANELLADGGTALVYVAKTWLPEAVQQVGQHLTYVWSLAVSDFRVAQVMNNGGFMPLHRLVLLYSKGKYRQRTPKALRDCLKAGNDKLTWHPWQQDLNSLVHWLDCLTLPDETIVDLCLGGGTAAVATKRLGKRQFIGCDIDEKAINRVKIRLTDSLTARQLASMTE